MIPSCSGPKWRRTAHERLGGEIEVIPDDWGLTHGRFPAARIYRVRGGSNDGRWFWAVQIDAHGRPFNSGTGYADNGREAKEACERILSALLVDGAEARLDLKAVETGGKDGLARPT